MPRNVHIIVDNYGGLENICCTTINPKKAAGVFARLVKENCHELDPEDEWDKELIDAKGGDSDYLLAPGIFTWLCESVIGVSVSGKLYRLSDEFGDAMVKWKEMDLEE